MRPGSGFDSTHPPLTPWDRQGPDGSEVLGVLVLGCRVGDRNGSIRPLPRPLKSGSVCSFTGPFAFVETTRASPGLRLCPPPPGPTPGPKDKRRVRGDSSGEEEVPSLTTVLESDPWFVGTGGYAGSGASQSGCLVRVHPAATPLGSRPVPGTQVSTGETGVRRGRSFRGRLWRVEARLRSGPG